jgi:glycosyltransferase involved in cell wall biosynthesis
VAPEMEIIVVDDGSTDKLESRILNLESTKIIFLKQDHKGPGAARNLGATKAKGEILVFVDADMEFAPDFIEKLCKPIKNDVIGTFSKEEYLLNKDKPIARYWNINFGRKSEKMHSDDYPDEQSVFRAILKSEFDKAGGFDTNIGYTDDWSLARKLNTMAIVAPNAVLYHKNPETYRDVWKQARWFGKNEFLTKNLIRKVYNLVRYCPLTALAKLPDLQFVKFKLVFSTAVFVSVLLSFFNEPKSK